MANQVYDAVIIGAGPAGVSCAVWLSLLGFKVVVIERSNHIGGLAANNPYQDVWNVTAPELTGEDAAKQMRKSIDHARVPVLFEQSVYDIQSVNLLSDFKLNKVERGAPQYKIFFKNTKDGLESRAIVARSVVIATGVKYKRPPEMGSKNYPQILVGPGKHVYQHDFVMREIAILGGGDNAMENAIYLAQRGAKSIDVYSRTLRAQNKWMKNIPQDSLHLGPYKFDPDHMSVNGKRYDTILVFYGYEPQLDGLPDIGLRVQENGYLWTDEKTAQTNIPGIYAIGEVANRMHPCVVTSMADGIVAAKAIQFVLEFKD